jgi:hypothetical protein
MALLRSSAVSNPKPTLRKQSGVGYLVAPGSKPSRQGPLAWGLHDSTDAHGIFHVTGTGTLNHATLQDATRRTYSVSGTRWFGGSAHDLDANHPIAFTSTDKFAIRTATGGVFAMVNFIEHISPNRKYIAFDFGYCSD